MYKVNVKSLSQTVLDQALSLPVEERIRVVDQLLLSLNSTAQKEVDQAWAEEAERRAKQIESGEVQSISWEDSEEKVNALLDR